MKEEASTKTNVFGTGRFGAGLGGDLRLSLPSRVREVVLVRVASSSSLAPSLTIHLSGLSEKLLHLNLVIGTAAARSLATFFSSLGFSFLMLFSFFLFCFDSAALIALSVAAFFFLSSAFLALS